MLDSECSRGAVASDASLVATYNKAFKSQANYGVCGPSTAWRKNDKFTTENDFVVIHFAGPVVYSCTEFVDKNRDALFDHVNTLLAASTNRLVGGLDRLFVAVFGSNTVLIFVYLILLARSPPCSARMMLAVPFVQGT